MKKNTTSSKTIIFQAPLSSEASRNLRSQVEEFEAHVRLRLDENYRPLNTSMCSDGIFIYLTIIYEVTERSNNETNN